MAEVLGIVSAAIAFAQATAAILDQINKIKDSPKNIRELRNELKGFEMVLLQIDNLSWKQGDPIETVLRSCSDTLMQLRDLVAPFQQDIEDNKLKQYVKGLRMRPKESEIENVVKRLQSLKLTLTLALIASNSGGSDKAILNTTMTNNRHDMILPLELTPESNGITGWDMEMLSRIIDQRVTVAAQLFRRGPKLKIGNLPGVDGAQVNDIWQLDFESIRNLKDAAEEKKRERRDIKQFSVPKNLTDHMSTEFLESLCTPDYQQDRVRIKDASDTTCEWIWHHDVYISFRSCTQSRILHVCGNAGSGKSVLAKHVWKRLSNELADSPGNDSSALLYYCCDGRTRPDEAGSSILSALIHQLILQRPSLFSSAVERSELMQSRSFSGGHMTWTFDSLWSVFRDIVVNSQVEIIYCIIDALDECENESMEMLLSLLPDLLDEETSGVTVKFFLTSRIEGHIINALESHAISITVNSTVTRPDIETYVGEKLVRLRKRLRLNAEEEQNLRQLLGDRADGMFLWADLAIKELEKTHGIRASTVASRVRSLPSGLNALYERMLIKIDEVCEDPDTIRLARKILTWVTLAARPLSLAELKIALAIELDTKCVASVEPLRNVSYDLLSLCGSFIQIVRANDEASQADGDLPAVEGHIVNEDSEDSTATVRLIHQSAKEYLVDSATLNDSLSKFRISSQTANGEIAKMCLTYLLFKDFESGPVTEGDKNNPKNAEGTDLLKQKLKEYEFLEYAALYWPTHVREGGVDDVDLYASKFLNDFPQQFESWYQISEFLSTTEIKYNAGVLGIHMAARWGLVIVLKLLLDEGADIASKTAAKCTALHFAASHGHLEAAKLLLDRGVEIEATGTTVEFTALHYAAQGGYVEIVRLLLAQDVNVNVKSQSGRTPLYLAALKGHTEVIKLLLGQGAEAETAEQVGFTPLHAAAEFGHIEVVKVLFERNVNVNCRSQSNRTPLYLAAQKGHTEVVKLLLGQRAEVNTAEKTGWSPLHVAVEYGQIEVIKVLVDQDVNLNAKIQDGRTPLHVASWKGQIEVIKLLLKQGAELNTTERIEWSPLHIAARNGYIDVAELFLDQGAEIEAKSTQNWTALHVAADEGMLDIVKLLLDRGADIRANIDDNCTALHLAAESGHLEVVKLLLNQGAEIEAKDTDDTTALLYAADSEHLEIVKLLLDQGAEIEVRDNQAYTALHFAAESGHLEVVKLLLDRGANIEAEGADHYTPLQYAAEYGHEPVAKLLLDQGADIEARDTDSCTALQHAAGFGHLPVVQLLLDKGADIEANDNENRTALHRAAQNGELEVAKVLLQRGAKISLPEQNLWTPVYAAAENGHVEVVKLLLDTRVNLNSREYGNILRAAACNGKEELVQFLLEQDADVSEKSDVYGEALQLGCIKGSVAVVDSLMRAGADVNKVDEHGWNAVLCASQFQETVMERLLASGGDLSLAPRNLTLPPTSWSPTDKASLLVLDEDAMTIKYPIAEDSGMTKAALVRANHPIPLQDHGGFYFEITILDSGDNGAIGLGLCNGHSSLVTMPGWHTSSWGYHGDDGRRFNSGEEGKTYGDKFGTGDVVGCYIAFDKGITFTKNGTSFGNAVDAIAGKLYPAVGLLSRGACIRVNFGHEPFRYDVSLAEGVRPESPHI